MSMGLARLAAVLVSLCIAPSLYAQTTVTLMEGLNGYAGSTDNAITSNAPTTNYGAMATYQLRPESVNSLLVRFAIFAAEGGPLPDGATITSATLSLYKYWGPAATFKASRLKKSWSESQSTWNVAATGTAWESAGALGATDVEGSADGQGSVGDAQVDGCSTSGPWPEACWLHIDVTTGVQAFGNGAANHGWKLAFVSGPNESNAKEFNSTENTSWPSLRPKLTVTYTTQPPCSPGPFGGTPAAAPGEIEAENFDCGGEGVAYHDLTPGNQSTSTYRNPESVDVMDLAGAGRTVQHFDTGEWMNFTISVATAGTYSVAIHAASNWVPQGQVAGQYSVETGASSTGSVEVVSTGSWDTYAWTEAPTTMVLNAGQHVLKLRSVQQSYRVDKLRLEYVGPPPPSCDSAPQRPFGSSAIQVPGGGATFEAEDYDCGGEGVAYHDATTGNQTGSTYRPGESVDIWDIPGGGRVVRNFDTGEWMEYTINVATAGNYRLGIMAGHNATPGQYRIEIDGNDATGNVTVPSTGSWDIYQWFDAPGAVALSAGQHVVRLVSAQEHYRVEKLRVSPEGGTPPSGDGCDAPGLQMCVRFEPAPDTQFSGVQVTSQSLGSTITWSVQNKAADSATDTSRIGLVSGGRDGGTALRFATLDNDSNVHGSGQWERSEVQLSVAATGGTQGNEHWWAHSLYLPAEFQMPSGTYNSHLVVQFHGVGGGAQPNFALGLFNEPGTNRMVLRAQTYGAGGGGDNEQYWYNVAPSHYVKGACIHDSPQEGVWYDFVHRIRWSATGTGIHEIWMRQAGGAVKKVLEKTGINTLYSGNSAYLKLGLYHGNVPGTSAAIHDRIRRGTSFAAVAMPDFTMPSGGVVGCNY
jgi:hypothetical protein